MKYTYTILLSDTGSILHGMETDNFDSALLIAKTLEKEGMKVTIQTRVKAA